MNCLCQQLTQTNSKSNLSILKRQQMEYRQLPLKIKLAKLLSIDSILIDKYVFNQQQRSYLIAENNLFMKQIMFLIKNPQNVPKYKLYIPPSGYTLKAALLLGSQGHKIPVVRFERQNAKNPHPCIVYSHGNNSELSNSVRFIQRFCLKWYEGSLQSHQQPTAKNFKKSLPFDFVCFDYKGYKQTENDKFKPTQESFYDDMKQVIKWINLPQHLIILWGFSLGNSCVINENANKNFLGTILMAPFASLGNMLNSLDQINAIPYRDDAFNNIQKIGKTKTENILLIHGEDDEIIPIKHSEVLYEKYMQDKQASWVGNQKIRQIRQILKNNISFYKIGKIKHNNFQSLITSLIENQVQQIVFQFLERCLKSIPKRQKAQIQQPSIKWPKQPNQHQYFHETMNKKQESVLDSEQEQSSQQPLQQKYEQAPLVIHQFTTRKNQMSHYF